MYLIGLIRVWTSNDPEVVNFHGRVIEERYGVPVLSRAIPDQPHGIHDEETERVAVPKIVELGVQLEREGCRAILVSCAGDPICLWRGISDVPLASSSSAAGAGGRS